ncbi:magnesium chelatase subunit D [Novosphingobium sp. Gsoil 351]|uniref:magnesium chelatase subunit D n=1 Tax=Novosphingobium sp. Gsoil 351 TaxID=2675225 RepID=UPI0012B4E0CC|nr:magnesium chelatase subunit D [Novosphingobium sp. Gsoil 351]QGN54576.1 magnesium chelatase subunit D [Novosphingobium sp. Gsoil 351]
MSPEDFESAAAAKPGEDALLAARLFLIDPIGLGGLVLRGAGPARDAVVESIRAHLPLRRLPANVDDARLLGGIDIAASLTAGKPVHERGLLAEAAGGALLVTMAERIEDATAGRLAQATEGEARVALVLLDDGANPDERPAPALVERLAFACDLSGSRGIAALRACQMPGILPREVAAAEAALEALAATSLALGIDSARALGFALRAARAHAALNGRTVLDQADLQVAARLVLAPRATRLPASEADATPESGEQEPHDGGEGDERQLEAPPEDMVLAAAIAAIPPDVLSAIAEGRATRSARGSGAGAKRHSKLRGRPLGARPGTPRGGARLALIDTLRAAVPWQALRRRETGTVAGRLLIHKADLRIRRFAERAGAVTVFCVDASGSAALARLAEAKGAVELMLAQAYVKRAEVALVAFRGAGAELILPPTRSLVRARRTLAELPGGGGTPLAAGLTLAQRVSESAAARGHTPFLVVMTDGRANIAADGAPGRVAAVADATAAARRIAAHGTAGIVIDISARPRPEAAQLANAMRARYLPLPFGDARTVHRAVTAA